MRLLRLSGGALAADPNQQSARTHSARDQAENPRRRLVPGWAIGTQSRRGQAAPYRGHRLVNQTLSEYRAAEGPADERCYHRLSQCRAPLSPNQMCEKLWTLPRPMRRTRLLPFLIQIGNKFLDQFVVSLVSDRYRYFPDIKRPVSGWR